MSGPWEKYGAAADGPWNKFRKAPPAAAAPKLDPTGGFMENVAAGAGKAVADTGTGLKQLGAEAVNAVAPSLVSDETTAGIQADVDATKKRDAPLMDTGGGITGNVAGNLAMLAIPGGALGLTGKALNVARAMLAPRTLKGAAALGTVAGATQPVASDDSRVENMAVGGVGGVAGNAIPKVAGALLKGNTRPQVQQLLDEGVKLTPGQIAGGTIQRLEESATSIPLVGDAIRGSMARANDSFNKAALQRALEPIGEKVTLTGRGGIEEVESKLGAFYDRLLPKLTVKLDPQFAVDVRTVKAAAANLPDEQAKQFDKIITNEVLKKFSTGRMTGEEMKVIDSELGRLARGYQGDAAFANRELAHTIRDAQTALRDLVTRGNPQLAPELKRANEGWANFVRVQRAATNQGATEGVFTPSQLSGAVKANDSSLRRGAFARGDALMEDLSDAGTSVMRKQVPDSGTPLRAMVGAGTLGGAAYLDPVVAGVMLAAAGAYTSPAQKIITALMARRPDAMRRAGKLAELPSPYLTLPGAAVAQAIAQQGEQ